MPAHVRIALSNGAHALVVLAVGVAVAHGIRISAHWSGLAETLLLTAAVGGYSGVTHWLAARKGNGRWPRAARFAARVLALGTKALQLARPTPTAAKHLGAKS